MFYYLKDSKIAKISLYFPRMRGFKRVDDKKVLDRFVNWSKKGIFKKIFSQLLLMKDIPSQFQIDTTYIKAHRTSLSLLKKGILLV